MTYEEAIFLLDDIKIYIPLEPDAYKYEEAINTAMGALKRSIPKKPLQYDKSVLGGGLYRCPICGANLGARMINKEMRIKGCRYCLQAIDWGSDEG